MALLTSQAPFFSKPLSKPITFKATPSVPNSLSPSIRIPFFSSKSSPIPRFKTLTPLPSSSSSSFTLNFEDDDDEELSLDSSWEGAIVYKRDASASHLEYCTTLERLGLGKLSSGVSKSRASAMGIRVPHRRGKEAGSGGDGTPVLVSVDVTRRKRRLKLDGIVRTVITLGCNRCAEPAAESVFSNFSLLLTEYPVEESDDEINMGVIYGEDKHKSSATSRTEEEEDDDEKEIDPDDRLHFPSEEKEIDISKPIRDLVHLEITLNAICDANCKGLCLRCGANLNKSRCSCSEKDVPEGEYGPLKNLRKQFQKR